MDKLKEKYDEYLELNYIKSREDPDEEPYRTKYEARKLLELLIGQVEPNISVSTESSEFLKSQEITQLHDTYVQYFNKIDSVSQKEFSQSAKSFLICKLFEFNLARNFIETEEVESGEKILSKIIRDLDKFNDPNPEGNNYNPIYFSLKLNCFNELIFVWSHRSDYKKCLTLILAIDEIYQIFKDNCVSSGDELKIPPFHPSEIILLNEKLTIKDRLKSFEAIYTHSLYFFAQVFGKLDEKEKSAVYCTMTLQRQLDQHNEASEDNSDETKSIYRFDPSLERVQFNPLDWATHAAAISQYYVCENDFSTARHCLCCAEAILDQLHSDESLNKDMKERLSEQTASIRRCWGKYAIELLQASKRRLLESTEQLDQKSLINELDKPPKFRFNLPLSKYKLDVSEKNAITANIALDFDQARVIFLKAQTILEQAKDFFKLDGYVSDHCEIVRDLSDLYSALIFFESDPDRRCKMLKRRLDLQIPVCDEISEQFYLTFKRQYLFDIGSIYSELMDNKIDIFKEKRKNQLSPKESASCVQKINQLANSGLLRFEKFLDTMKVQPKREVLPEKFDDHNVRPALLAKFYIGRLFSKIIAVEPSIRLENIKQTMDNYKYLVDYCDKEKNDGNEDPMDRMINEYTVCKEMIVFLPAQMDKLRTLIQ